MQEELERRSVLLIAKTSNLTARGLALMMRTVIQRTQKRRDNPKPGKTSMRKLAENGVLRNIEITDGNIKAFDRVARKYGILYAIQKDAGVNPPRWLIFFRSRDADALTAAFKEFSANVLKPERSRPSTREAPQKSRDITEDAVRGMTRRKERSGPER